MHDLVRPDRYMERFRHVGAVLENSRPPLQGDSRIDDQVDRAEHHACQPTNGQPKANRVDGRMNPGRRVQQAVFVFRHPVILQQPVGNEVSDERALEGSECHLVGENRSGLTRGLRDCFA